MIPFALSVALAGVSAAIVVAMIAGPFHRVVIDLCGTRERARFWTVYVSLLFIVGPMLAVSFASMVGGALELEATLFWALGALFIGLVVFGGKVWKPTQRLFEDERRAAAAREG